jgi:hypothetical protein
MQDFVKNNYAKLVIIRGIEIHIHSLVTIAKSSINRFCPSSTEALD